MAMLTIEHPLAHIAAWVRPVSEVDTGHSGYQGAILVSQSGCHTDYVLLGMTCEHAQNLSEPFCMATKGHWSVLVAASAGKIGLERGVIPVG